MLISTEYNYGSINVNNYSSLTRYNHSYKFGVMKYGERLFKARTYAKLTQGQLADKIKDGCTQENISKLERGDATGSEYTAQFADACGVRALWLAVGAGEMVPSYYSTNDPKLVAMLKVMEPQAEYVKDAAVKAVLTTCELADRARSNGTHD